MKKYIINNKKIFIILIVLLIIICSVFIVKKIIKNKNKINVINNKAYSFKFDDTWEVSKEEELEAKLSHKKSKSELNIKISELDEQVQYKSMDEIFDGLLYNIQKQNENYKLLYKEPAKLTNQEIDGYKMLFEDNDNQVSIYTYKQGSKLVVFIYEATNEYFDILLDNVNSIINSFNLMEKSFDAQTYINIETKPIEYTEDTEVSNLLNDSYEIELTNLNYNIKLSVPTNFASNSYDSRQAYLILKGLKDNNSLNLNAHVFPKNIYEYLDKKISGNLFESTKDLTLESEALDKREGNQLCYIYRYQYLFSGTKKEVVKLLYELDKSNILIIEISSSGVGIPKKLIEQIKINEIQNVASNFKIEKEDGYLIGTLKHYTDIKSEQTEEIKLKLPEDFKEKDIRSNLFAEREYISNYDELLQFPEYDVIYKIEPYDVEEKLNKLEESKSSSITEYNGFGEIEEKTYNNKTFKICTRNYSQLTPTSNYSGKKLEYKTNEMVLGYKISDNKNLYIIIKANNTELTDELINKLTNFDVNVK